MSFRRQVLANAVVAGDDGNHGSRRIRVGIDRKQSTSDRSGGLGDALMAAVEAGRRRRAAGDPKDAATCAAHRPSGGDRGRTLEDAAENAIKHIACAGIRNVLD